MTTNNVQTSYSVDMTALFLGMQGDNADRRVVSRNNSNATAIQIAVAVLQGTTERTCRPILSTDESAWVADDDAIIASGFATAAASVTKSTTGLNGVIGQTEISPPRNLTFTLSSHADFDANTHLIARGRDWRGEQIEEIVEVPNGGNVVLTGSKHFSFVKSVELSPQSGTGGAVLVGIGSSFGPINKLLAGISLATVGTREGGTFAQYDDVPCMRKGNVVVDCETSCSVGDPVYVRIVASGGEVRGEFRPTPDANDCALLVGARFLTAVSGGGLALLEVNL